jgi:hypothetical protein
MLETTDNLQTYMTKPEGRRLERKARKQDSLPIADFDEI